MIAAAYILALAVAAPREIAVSISGMKFSPATVEAHAGDVIVWTNDDIVPHTATGKGFDSGTIAAKQSFKWTVKGDGKLDYKCNFHPPMTGSITVTE